MSRRRSDNSIAHGAFSRIGIVDVLPALKRRWSLVAGLFVGIFAVCAAVTMMLPDRYTATAQISVDSRSGQLTSLNESMTSAAAMMTEIETQATVVVSPNVLGQAIADLRLWRTPDYAVRPSRIERVLDLFSLHEPESDTITSADSFASLDPAVRARLIERLAGNVSARRLGLTSVVEVRVTSSEPALAASIANAITTSYLNGQIDADVETAQRAVLLLEERVASLSRQVADGEEALQSFVEGESVAGASPAVQQQLAALRSELQSISSQEAEIRSRLSAYRQYLAAGSTDVLVAGGSDGTISAVLQERRNVERLLASGSAEPENLRERLAALDGQLRSNVDAQSTTLADEAEALEARSGEIRETFQTVLASQPVTSGLASEIFRLEQDIETSRRLYGSYLQRLEEVRQQASIPLSSSRVVSEAVQPTSPSFPPRSIFLALGFLLATGSATGAALLREMLFGGFVSRDQLEAVTGRDVVAQIPKIADEKPFLSMTKTDFSPFSESLRRLRGTLSLHRPESGKRTGTVILVTSTDPGEGKSTCSLSLARSFALVGREKTILIDADMRRPSLARMLECPEQDGLMQYFAFESVEGVDEGRIGSRIMVEHDHFDFIGCGTGHGKATDSLVASQRFSRLLDDLASRYDVVIVDSPPTNYVADAQIIAAKADITLYVVREAGSRQSHVMTGLREIARSAPDTLLLPLLYQSTSSRSGYGGYYYR